MAELARGGLLGMWEGHLVNLATGLTTSVKLSIRAKVADYEKSRGSADRISQEGARGEERNLKKSTVGGRKVMVAGTDTSS